jgi:hypothetical protein
MLLIVVDDIHDSHIFCDGHTHIWIESAGNGVVFIVLAT